jgi:hypothetical protein
MDEKGFLINKIDSTKEHSTYVYVTPPSKEASFLRESHNIVGNMTAK